MKQAEADLPPHLCARSRWAWPIRWRLCGEMQTNLSGRERERVSEPHRVRVGTPSVRGRGEEGGHHTQTSSGSYTLVRARRDIRVTSWAPPLSIQTGTVRTGKYLQLKRCVRACVCICACVRAHFLLSKNRKFNSNCFCCWRSVKGSLWYVHRLMIWAVLISRKWCPLTSCLLWGLPVQVLSLIADLFLADDFTD